MATAAMAMRAVLPVRKRFQTRINERKSRVRVNAGEEGIAASAVAHVEGLSRNFENSIYMLAAAVATADDGVAEAANEVSKKKGILTPLVDTFETLLKFIQGGLDHVHVPYSYGWSIVMLTLLVKTVTYPLTKTQVESSLNMQNLKPKIEAINKRYENEPELKQQATAKLYQENDINPLAGCLPVFATLPVFIALYRTLSQVSSEGLLTEGFYWIPSLSGPTTIAARQAGTGTAWLFPFVDGAPPIGWEDALAYLVLPVAIIAAQFASQEILQPPPTDDPKAQQTQAVLKFLPLMTGYFALCVPSGLTLYWFSNTAITIAQSIYLRKFGGAKARVEAQKYNMKLGTARRPAHLQYRYSERQLNEFKAREEQQRTAIAAQRAQAKSDYAETTAFVSGDEESMALRNAASNGRQQVSSTEKVEQKDDEGASIGETAVDKPKYIVKRKRKSDKVMRILA